MDILISNSCGRPIYQQIYDQIKTAILSGELREGDMLPSIRALAKDLRISVITTKRAYEELEQGGYIYTAAGKGCFVSQKSSGMVYEEHLKKIEEHMGEIARLAGSSGITEGQLIEMYRVLQEENR
ncbi:MAG: GntR family transcriptional regulator [Clostridiales bacterium]|nr:GntR family transcriptional regulator [Eubacteriales bacterium]MDD6014631.1 GntR family transcriptional regulator [Clostridiales bacterium]MDY5800556.1 GntR family transcriptional regulator [Eubacteriales bacterium]